MNLVSSEVLFRVTVSIDGRILFHRALQTDHIKRFPSRSQQVKITSLDPPTTTDVCLVTTPRPSHVLVDAWSHPNGPKRCSRNVEAQGPSDRRTGSDDGEAPSPGGLAEAGGTPNTTASCGNSKASRHVLGGRRSAWMCFSAVPQ